MSELDDLLPSDGLVVWLTGAGVSAESGVPTFRGEEGYWRVGSRNYHPQEMATLRAYGEMPDEVWAWYLYRRGICRLAEPNLAHKAIAAAEASAQQRPDRFVLITQNVDGLHLRAGNTLDRTYQIHGNLDFMRCAAGCTQRPFPIPDAIDPFWQRGRPIQNAERDALSCAACGGPTRPHVLWFDETYDEENFRFESALRAAGRASALIVVGTNGGTNLPMHVGTAAASRGIPIIVVNTEPNPFVELVDRSGRGLFCEGTAGHWVPQIVASLGR